MHTLWLLLLPVAAASGWYAAMSSCNPFRKQKKDQKSQLSRDYLQGLNFLLNEEPDKALDVFIKMLKVDSETVETHLALGNLFRRRGEVDRAIRIHQNLIARPNLDKEIRSQALSALAKDYLSAGVLDRAERLFLELVDMDARIQDSLHSLLDIYQQEKEWQKAIDIAHKLSHYSSEKARIAISNYYCEMAENAIQHVNFDRANKFLKRALSNDRHCVRASLLFASLEMKKKKYKQAIRHLKRVREQNSDFFSEAVVPLVNAFRALGKETELVLYFRNVLKEFPKMPIAIMLSEQIRQWRGDKVAVNFVADYVRKHPSIRGLHRLLELHIPLTEGKARNDLLIVYGLTEKLLSDQPLYRCGNCGFSGKTLHWQCPSCKQWGSVKPTHIFDE